MNTKGFTLLELMVTISIIATLVAMTFFPFSYYMERARVEKNADMIGQEWIALHQSVRNGLLEGDHHATLELETGVGSGAIRVFVYTGTTALKRELRTISLEKPLIVLGFSGSAPTGTTHMSYTIAPPFATGSFSLGGGASSYLSGLIMRIGYPDATTLDGGRARDILIRPYYD